MKEGVFIGKEYSLDWEPEDLSSPLMLSPASMAAFSTFVPFIHVINSYWAPFSQAVGSTQTPLTSCPYQAYCHLPFCSPTPLQSDPSVTWWVPHSCWGSWLSFYVNGAAFKFTFTTTGLIWGGWECCWEREGGMEGARQPPAEANTIQTSFYFSWFFSSYNFT